MKISKVHYMVTHYIGECGYFSYNLTKNKKKVTCKLCLKYLSKQYGGK
jgi:hypothetical protein